MKMLLLAAPQVAAVAIVFVATVEQTLWCCFTAIVVRTSNFTRGRGWVRQHNRAQHVTPDRFAAVVGRGRLLL